MKEGTAGDVPLPARAVPAEGEGSLPLYQDPSISSRMLL